MIKAEFSASLLQSSVPHDPAEIILIYSFAAQETFFFIILNVENSFCCLIFFVETVFHYHSKFGLFSSAISQYYCFYCIFDQISAILVSRETSFKDIKNHNYSKLLTGSEYEHKKIIMKE